MKRKKINEKEANNRIHYGRKKTIWRLRRGRKEKKKKKMGWVSESLNTHEKAG